MKVAVFEDGRAVNFLPLTYTRAVFDLRLGAYTQLERTVKGLGSVDAVFVRERLTAVYRERLKGAAVNPAEADDDIVFVNSRLVVDSRVAALVRKRVKDRAYFAVFEEGDPLLVYAPRSLADRLCEALAGGELGTFAKLCRENLGTLSLSATVIGYLWDLIRVNASILSSDVSGLCTGEWEGEVDSRAVIYGDSGVYVARGAVVEAYAVLDARGGPIYIGENTRVGPGAVIKGPAYIGRNSAVTAHALIRSGSNVGDFCHVGGELKETIIHGYSNKGHTGFMGRAYIGEWVNLGAMTTNSDLKDTYGTVKVNVGGRRVDTGLTKVGCFIGDMARTSIGTLIYTGKKVGVASHLHGIVYEDVPCFTIYAKSLGAEPVELYLESAIEIQRRMMRRRGKVLTRAEEELIRRLFEVTEEERRAAGVRRGRFAL